MIIYLLDRKSLFGANVTDVIKTFLVFPCCILTRYIIFSYSEILYVMMRYDTQWLVMCTVVISEIQKETANITISQIKLSISYKGILPHFCPWVFLHTLPSSIDEMSLLEFKWLILTIFSMELFGFWHELVRYHTSVIFWLIRDDHYIYYRIFFTSKEKLHFQVSEQLHHVQN